MIKIYYDLHIHSSLSPCASDEMLPSNIVNMAIIKGLDCISITDHNRALNVKAVIEVSKNTNLLVIPGIEVETFEGIHLVCYFETIKNLLEFESVIYASLPKVLINEKSFGRQCISDERDEIINCETFLLTVSSKYSLNEVIRLVKEYHGVVSLAHIERKSNGILSILGFIPADLEDCLIESNKSIVGKRSLSNSDAHDLVKINEGNYYFEVKERTVEAIFAYLKGER